MTTNLRLRPAILRPLVSEKATRLTENARPAYTFLVDSQATKQEIALEVKRLYSVKPLAVHIIKLPAKKVVVKGKRGVTSAKKKAVVYLKAGDKIEFV